MVKVYRKDGAYVGMLVRGAGEGFNLIVPIRRIRKWARAAGVEWALDDNAKAPTEEVLKKMLIEDIGVQFTAKVERDEPTEPAVRWNGHNYPVEEEPWRIFKGDDYRVRTMIRLDEPR